MTDVWRLIKKLAHFSNTWISFNFFEIEDLFVTNGNFVWASRIMYEFVLIS